MAVHARSPPPLLAPAPLDAPAPLEPLLEPPEELEGSGTLAVAPPHATADATSANVTKREEKTDRFGMRVSLARLRGRAEGCVYIQGTL